MLKDFHFSFLMISPSCSWRSSHVSAELFLRGETPSLHHQLCQVFDLAPSCESQPVTPQWPSPKWGFIACTVRPDLCTAVCCLAGVWKCLVSSKWRCIISFGNVLNWISAERLFPLFSLRFIIHPRFLYHLFTHGLVAIGWWYFQVQAAKQFE